MSPKVPETWNSEDELSSEKAKFTPFSAGVYRALILVLVAGAAGGYKVAKSHTNPDPRSPEKMAWDYYYYRPIVTTGKPGSPTEKMAADMGKTALCVLNQMCSPLGDRYEGKGKKECKRESNDFFIDNHEKGNPQKYVFWPNLDDYVNEKRPTLMYETLNAVRKDKDTKDSIKWFTAKYDAFKEGKTGNDDDLFKEFVQSFLTQPLECVKGVDNECIKTYDGSPCLLFADLAEAVTRANWAMHADGKGEIKPSVCFRTSLHQAIAYADIGNQGCNVTSSRPGGRAVTLPGNSNHIGAAMDVPNADVAEEYLAEVGMGCDKVEGDPGHCSFGEGATQGKLKSVGQRIRKFGKTIVRGGRYLWDQWRNRHHKKK